MEELVKNRLSDNSDIRVGIDVGSTTVKLVITDINIFKKSIIIQ